jgi:SAM-dependent methyltransferase
MNYDLPIDRKKYWELRKKEDLYILMPLIAKMITPKAQTVLDVGPYTSPLVLSMDWIPNKFVVEKNLEMKKNWESIKNVDFIHGDVLEFQNSNKFDLVICSQVIEHSDNPIIFAEKLMKLGKSLIVSTTYNVPFGKIEGHLQDPIDIPKFYSWFNKNPDITLICDHSSSKDIKFIIGVFKNLQ